MQLSDLARAPRALLQEKIFIFVSSVLLMLSAAATRVFISHYLIYRSDANTNLVQLLEEQNLPYRNETRNAILAAVQSIFFGSGAVLDCESPEQSADEKRLCRELDARHRSFEALTSALECPIADTDNKCAMQVADRAMSSWPDGNPRRHDITLSRLRKAIPELVAGAPHARIQPCVVDPINASVEWRRDRAGVHTQVFGAAGCDIPGDALASTLLVPSRQNECSANRMQPTPLNSLEECYTQRLLRANDFSLLLDDLFYFGEKNDASDLQHSASTATYGSDPTRRSDSTPLSESASGVYRIVQEYFISPDSFIRYRDLAENRPAIDVLGEARMWATSPFVQLPIDAHSKYRTVFAPSGAPSLSPREVAEDLCRAIPVRPYIDLGDYGFVETRCSCAVDPNGELIGVYCSDYTVPYSLPEKPKQDPEKMSPAARDPSASENPPGLFDYIPRLFEAVIPWLRRAFLEFRGRGENSLFAWRLINVPDGAIGSPSCDERIADVTERVDSAGPTKSSVDGLMNPAERRIDRDEASTLCAQINAAKTKFFQEVQTIPYRARNGPSSLFFIPISRRGGSQSGSRLGILLRPNPAGPPWRSTIFVVASWFLFATTFVWRARLQSMNADTLRDDAILRGLPAGVVDAAQWDRIEFANDRAEEIVGASLPVFGTRKDSIRSRDLFELIEEVMLESPEENRLRAWRSADTIDASDDQPPDPNGEKYVPISREEIDERRRLGEGSVYYARLKPNPRLRTNHSIDRHVDSSTLWEQHDNLELWVRIRGNALFGDETREQSRPRTFAIVQRVQRPEKQKELNDRYQLERKRLDDLLRSITATKPDSGS